MGRSQRPSPCVVLPLMAANMAILAAADRQGYTPYGYGMDTPVLVRASVSYGRGWQLLRSRGAGSNATGPCDPPQMASSCNCSSDKSAADDNSLPYCIPTSLCDDGSSRQITKPRSRLDIVFVVDANVSRLRFFYGRDAWRLYKSQLGLTARSVVSLRMHTSLPIHLLASGIRSAAAERWFSNSLGVHVLNGAPEPVTPVWASKWAKGSFAKLRVLALTQFERVLVLDTDTVAFASLDHLAVIPAPAMTFGWKCFPRRELRSALMLLQPSQDAWRRAQRLLDSKIGIYDDLGEQSVWRHLYEAVHELPAGYAALRCSDFPTAEWRRVQVLHDPNLLRKTSRLGWREAGMNERLRHVEAHATNQTKGLWALLKAEEDAARAAASMEKVVKKRRGKARRWR